MTLDILLTGSRGQLGTEIRKILTTRGITFEAIDIEEADIIDEKKVVDTIRRYSPKIVIHTAAFTDVEGCEIDNDRAKRVNILGSRNVAVGTERVGGKVIYISTDYVFDGKLAINKSNTEDSAPNPINVYGETKFGGEVQVLGMNEANCVVRTAQLFGIAMSRIKKTNCVENLLNAASREGPLRAVSDQRINVTYAKHLAQALVDLATYDGRKGTIGGIYHLTNQGVTTWYEFARAIIEEAGLEKEVIGITAQEAKSLFDSRVNRPMNSSLKNIRAASLGIVLPEWREGLREYLEEKKMAVQVA